MTRFVLYPLAAIGAAAIGVVTTAAAIVWTAHKADDAKVVGQLNTLAAAQPPTLSEDQVDELVRRIDLEQLWEAGR